MDFEKEIGRNPTLITSLTHTVDPQSQHLSNVTHSNINHINLNPDPPHDFDQIIGRQPTKISPVSINQYNPLMNHNLQLNPAYQRGPIQDSMVKYMETNQTNNPVKNYQNQYQLHLPEQNTFKKDNRACLVNNVQYPEKIGHTNAGKFESLHSINMSSNNSNECMQKTESEYIPDHPRLQNFRDMNSNMVTQSMVPSGGENGRTDTSIMSYDKSGTSQNYGIGYLEKQRMSNNTNAVENVLMFKIGRPIQGTSIQYGQNMTNTFKKSESSDNMAHPQNSKQPMPKPDPTDQKQKLPSQNLSPYEMQKTLTDTLYNANSKLNPKSSQKENQQDPQYQYPVLTTFQRQASIPLEKPNTQSIKPHHQFLPYQQQQSLADSDITFKSNIINDQQQAPKPYPITYSRTQSIKNSNTESEITNKQIQKEENPRNFANMPNPQSLCSNDFEKPNLVKSVSINTAPVEKKQTNILFTTLNIDNVENQERQLKNSSSMPISDMYNKPYHHMRNDSVPSYFQGQLLHENPNQRCQTAPLHQDSMTSNNQSSNSEISEKDSEVKVNSNNYQTAECLSLHESFVPEPEQILTKLPSGKILRFIYEGGTTFEPEETEIINRLRDWIYVLLEEKKPQEWLTLRYEFEDPVYLRHYYGCNENFNMTIESLIETA